ncbi:hypothetical protein VQ042_20840 [Aurantimonas sp. A2-1-M11]|uniref:hypothetical protein n=1 Tax=Aurantimonas sp. A2-1-M11 TaxID=3113712 RepID=UPI002F924594
MARRVIVDIDGLEAMAEAFGNLGKYALPDAAQAALNEIAKDSIGEMASRFERAIEGGPVAFTKPKPGRRNSSVLAKTPRGATKGEAEASIYVQKAQSTYLKYQLGEDNDGVRQAGDVGAASEYNFIPDPQALRKHQGISLTAESRYRAGQGSGAGEGCGGHGAPARRRGGRGTPGGDGGRGLGRFLGGAGFQEPFKCGLEAVQGIVLILEGLSGDINGQAMSCLRGLPQ